MAAIDNLGIPATTFGITSADKQAMMKHGEAVTMTHLQDAGLATV